MRAPRSTGNGASPEIDQDDLDLAAIVGIDRAGRIEHGDAVPQREPGARPDLAFGAGRQRDRDAGRDRGPPARAR